ncbi:uncharacterized protein B0H64DRAFT_373025 [Chaetomium fimeti]|uniref:Uncharacterized protein n=1 Tax=Chaetomium fimeti TaxID=1854472 RepID=A0AAE0HJL0_9PEZI|nr:hypothetical protein B0H64DRAFT_373025 [Chaetomium fimeti]
MAKATTRPSNEDPSRLAWAGPETQMLKLGGCGHDVARNVNLSIINNSSKVSCLSPSHCRELVRRNISRVARHKTDREGSDAHDDDAAVIEWRLATVEAAGCSATFAFVGPAGVPPPPQSPQSNSSCIESRPGSDLGRPFPLAALAHGLVNGTIFTAGTNYYDCLSGVQFLLQLLQEEGWRRRPHETLDFRQCQPAPA